MVGVLTCARVCVVCVVYLCHSKALEFDPFHVKALYRRAQV